MIMNSLINPPKTLSKMSSLCTRLHPIFSKSPKNVFFFSSATATASSTTITTDSDTDSATTSTPTTVAGAATGIEKFVENFKKKSICSDFRNHISYYDGVVRRLAAEEHFSAIEHILEHQKTYEEDMAKEEFGVRLIKLYGKAGMFDHAYKVFDELPEFDCPRTVVSFNALLCACVDSKNLPKVGKLFEELPEKLGIEPDLVSYNTVIRGLCEVRDFVSALDVIEQMEGSEVRPDVVSYNTVMEGYYKENKMDEAKKLWRRMEEKGVIANVRCYDSMIRCLVKNDQVQEALEMVEKMGNEKVNPDMLTYKAVIVGCVGTGKLEEARMVYEKMVGEGFRLLDTRNYEMLISFACDKDDIDFALELYKHALEANVYISKSLMQRGVDALLKRSKIEEANELVKLVNSSRKARHALASPDTA